ncbi:MAG: carbamoyl phosphate synthase large subunit, partial [Streptococcus salivarius]
RPAGGFTIDVYNYAHSFDLYKGYADIVAGEPFPASQFEPLYCLATSRRVSSHYAYSEEELFDKYREQLKVKKIMPAAFAELQGDFLYMLTTPSREEMEQMIEDFGKKA